jgi:hypothetical protein
VVTFKNLGERDRKTANSKAILKGHTAIVNGPLLVRVRQRIPASQTVVVGGVGSGAARTEGAETFGLAYRRRRRTAPNFAHMLGAGLLTPPTGATVCWARVSCPPHRRDRRSPIARPARRGGSERYRAANPIARIHWRTLLVLHATAAAFW